MSCVQLIQVDSSLHAGHLCVAVGPQKHPTVVNRATHRETEVGHDGVGSPHESGTPLLRIKFYYRYQKSQKIFLLEISHSFTKCIHLPSEKSLILIEKIIMLKMSGILNLLNTMLKTFLSPLVSPNRIKYIDGDKGSKNCHGAQNYPV